MKLSLVSVIALAASGLLVACETSSGTGDGPPSAQMAENSREAIAPVQAGDSYYTAAQAAVQARVDRRGLQSAKNTILFVGDGMGISTITAARIYGGQKEGLDGEGYRLTMETLPAAALSKTYAHDGQVSDSAATATAMLSGVKTNMRTLGLTKEAQFERCDVPGANTTQTLFELAEDQGLATGIVSTARITHATPAAAYAKSVSRDWEDDRDLGRAVDAGCVDIASQLIAWPNGDGFEIALGGGRAKFRPDTVADEEKPDGMGNRGDKKDLTAAWVDKSDNHVVVTDRAGFETVDFSSPARVLGLFDPSHMQYELDRETDTGGEPSLAEMTTAAITRLSQGDAGFILLVEAGRIDHAHHGGNAKRALEDTLAFDAAIKAALEMTGDDTLVMVTADHSHVFTIAGYPQRGNPILGLAGYETGEVALGSDGKPYTTLGYANGPGAICGAEDMCERPDLTGVDTTDNNFQQQALVPMYSETHAGEDVAIFAGGPGSDLVGGVMEQNEIFHVIGRAMGLIK